MPVPAPVLYPPFNVVRLSHAQLRVTDLGRARAFYVDTLGLQVSEAAPDALYLRGLEERAHHSLVLRRGPEPAVDAVGLRVFDEDDLDRAARFFAGRGLPVDWPERPFAGRVLRTADPWGVPLELHAGMDRLPVIAQRYELYRGARPLRIDHANLFSPDVDGATAFWNAMGFRVTEYTEDAETGKAWAVWMHRKGGVHDVAFTNGLGPRLHHVAYWVANPLHIIDLLDLMSTTGWTGAIERGPGRHGISNAFFLYVRDPDGHRVELYSSDYQTVDPDHEPIRWDLTDPQRQTLWGAPAPRSWFEEGSRFDGLAPVAPALAAQPIVAP